MIAITGAGKRELLGKSLSEALSRVMEERRIYCCQGADQPLPVTDGNDRYTAAVAAPILCEGDVLGLVLFLSAEGQVPGEGSISWPRPCPPSWESTWNRENRPPEVLPPAVSISGSDSSPISFSERIAIGCAGLIGVSFHVFTKCLVDNKIFQIDHLIIKRSPGNRIFCSDNAELTTLVKIGNAGLNIGLGYCFF